MAVQSGAGAALAVSATLPATNDASGFGAVSFTNIGEVTNLGEFSRQYNLITYTALDERQIKKLKGSYDEGTIPVSLAYDPSDAGQAILEAARDSDNNYSFRVTLQDGTFFYFQAKVTSYTVNVSGVDDVTSSTCQIAITEQIVKV